MSSSDAILQPYDNFRDGLFYFEISTSQHVTFYDRRDYSLLDFIGDVSAVYTALVSIFFFINQKVFMADNLRNNVIINEVFQFRDSSKAGQTTKFKLHQRRILLQTLCSFPFCCKNRKNKYLKQVKKTRKVALRRINRELDIV
jgi:hypothetical protein